MDSNQRVLVWDLPTRAFHWLLAASFAGAFLTADSERYRDVHVALGYTVLGLVAFRIAWGLVGSRYARFASFRFGPRAVLSYLKSIVRGRPQHYPGHNPAGSWAIYALLALVAGAAASGWAAYSGVGGHAMEELHEGLANACLAAVGVHLAGVIVSSVLHRENLARAMWTGYKRGEAAAGIRRAHGAIGVLLVAAVAGFWFVGL